MKTQIWYMNKQQFRAGISGENDPNPKNLSLTHVLVDEPETDYGTIDLEEIFYHYNHWRGNEKSNSAGHTSMSVGDVVVIGDDVFIVRGIGFDKIN